MNENGAEGARTDPKNPTRFTETARDELFRNMDIGRLGALGAEALIDAFAHELAEKIRQRPTRLAPGSIRTAAEGRAYGRIIGLQEAANLIDPEVTR